MAGKTWKPEVVQARIQAGDLGAVREQFCEGESEFEDYEFTGGEIEAEDLYGSTFTRCIFRRCRFARAELGQSSFIDSVFEGCDFSNAGLEESLWRRCELTDCRMVGARFGASRFRQVRLKNCTAEFAGFDRASFQSVRFEACKFGEAWLRSCKCKEVEAAGCSFFKTNFYQTPLAGLDFTTSEIGGWTLSETAPELRGAIVSPIQAVELAERLGLIVKTTEDRDL